MNGILSKFCLWTIGLLLLVVTGSGAALAAATPWQETDYSRVRIVTAGEMLGEAGKATIGLQFELQEGWKTYWRSPGDAGFPVSIDLSGSENLAASEFLWPVPHRFTLFGLETFGYSKEVVFPITLQAKDPTRDLHLRGAVSYLLCQEICIPYDSEFELTLPAGETFPALEAPIVERYLTQVPGQGAEQGLGFGGLSLSGEGEELRLIVEARATGSAFDNPDIIVEGPPGFSFARPDVTLREGGQQARLEMAVTKSPELEGVLEGKRLTLTLFDGTRGMEVSEVARYDPAIAGEPVTGEGLLLFLGLALAGGLILNLMPCVLPVLSIKLLSVIKQGGKERQALRRSFLAISAGIVVSFWGLAIAAIALKAGGLAIGWGIQFQQPLFLVVMGVLVTLFAANLFGWFEIITPGELNDAAVAASHRKGLGGDFLTGVFATLMATPCSAPFLGTAVGFALARGPLEILAIFTLLGVGMAVPYLLVAARPALAYFLPKPGMWMVRLRIVLGFVLLGTAVWLLSVLGAQIGFTAALLIGGVFAVILAVLALKRFAFVLRSAVAAVLVALALAVPSGFSEEPRERVLEGLWQPFEQQRIAGLVEQGQLVFVDVTADWCLTCQVNKSLVLSDDAVIGELSKERMVPMLADWTRPSAEITDYLKSHDRYGIPFNVVYGPGAPEGIVLSELLTLDETLAAIERAAAGRTSDEAQEATIAGE